MQINEFNLLADIREWLTNGGIINDVYHDAQSVADAITETLKSENLLADRLASALRDTHEQLSGWLADTETCDLSPEDEAALDQAVLALDQYQGERCV